MRALQFVMAPAIVTVLIREVVPHWQWSASAGRPRARSLVDSLDSSGFAKGTYVVCHVMAFVLNTENAPYDRPPEFGLD